MDSPATLVFVRHAAADCSRDGSVLLCGRYDAPLSLEGHLQLPLLGRRLSAECGFNAVCASPLRRALETAEAAPEPLRQSMRILTSLAEIDCGNVDGVPIEYVRRQHSDVWIENEAQVNEDFSWPGGESYRAFRKRVLRAVSAIARVHAGHRVLIITHAGVINQVLGSISGQSAARWRTPRPRNASITRILWGGNNRSVVSFDDCSHLNPS